MTDWTTARVTPKTLAELRQLLTDWQEAVKPYGFRLMPPDEYYALAHAAVNALPALLDAAELLADVRDQVTRGALCPMCSTGMTRRTVGLVCPVCGTDYARSEYASMRRDSEETSKAALADALAVRAERDELAATVARVRALHACESRTIAFVMGDPVVIEECAECDAGYPCPTIRALDESEANK